MVDYEWEVDMDGNVGKLKIEENAGNPPTYTGTIEVQNFPQEPLTNIIMENSIISFHRPSKNLKYHGIIHGDEILGTYTNYDYDFPWTGKIWPFDGLANLGDFNQDGKIDNTDIVDFIKSYGINITTYRVSDDIYNPFCFDLLEKPPDNVDITSESWKWRPDGLAKNISSKKRLELGVPDCPIPPEILPFIKYVGKIFMRFPRSLIEPLFQDKEWSMDFSGILNGPNTVTSGWSINVNGYKGILFIYSLEYTTGRIKMDNLNRWEAVYGGVALYPRRRFGKKIEFTRKLIDGRKQKYRGTVSGPSSKGILGNHVEGVFKQDGSPHQYTWVGEGEIRSDGVSNLKIIANNQSGTLKIRLGALSRYAGRIFLDEIPRGSGDPWHLSPSELAKQWHEITNIKINQNNVEFDLPDIDRHFSGTIQNNNISGVFTVGNDSSKYNWNGSRIFHQAGTCVKYEHKSDREEIGSIKKMVCYMLYFTYPDGVLEEAISHPIGYALKEGSPPFDQIFMGEKYIIEKYKRAGFAAISSTPVYDNGRPVGWISAYASKSEDEDFANTFNAYIFNPHWFWDLVWRDRLIYKSDKLWNKREFIKSYIMGDLNIDGDQPGWWEINADKNKTKLRITIEPNYDNNLKGPVIKGEIFDREQGKWINPNRLRFNGVNIQFLYNKSDTYDPSGKKTQFYIGTLKEDTITGFFTDKGDSYEWNAKFIPEVR